MSNIVQDTVQNTAQDIEVVEEVVEETTGFNKDMILPGISACLCFLAMVASLIAFIRLKSDVPEVNPCTGEVDPPELVMSKDPRTGKQVCDYEQETFMTASEKRYKIIRPPYGWFNELELKAKGHPLSRISRRIE